MDFNDFMNSFGKTLDEGKELMEQFKHPTSSYNLSKKDIKQDDIASTRKDLIEKQQKLREKFNSKNQTSSQSLIKDGKFYDDFESFTEFEDENGNILLIRYGTVEYEFRGNIYCKYILCNEKTNSREEGVAQIKNGQKNHIKDPDRVLKIKEYMAHILEIHKNEWCKNRVIPIETWAGDDLDSLRRTTFNVDAIYMGYCEGSFFHDKIIVYYKIEKEKLMDNEYLRGFIKSRDYQKNNKYVYCKIRIPDEDTVDDIMRESELINIKNNNGEDSFKLKEFIGF